MIDPITRAAAPADRAQIAELEALARSTLIGQRGGDRWLDTHPAHGGRTDDADVWVAIIDEVVVGYLRASLRDGVARIDDVFVHPEARELGFGDALLEAALTGARAAGASLLEGESLPGDRDTKNLYERAGIKARLITVSTPL